VIARPQLSIARARGGCVTKPDASLLNGVVVPEVLSAMKTASEALRRVGVRHVVVGGLAVAANGFRRATGDVDFLVGAEAFEYHEGGLVSLKRGVPFQVGGVAVDLLSPQSDESFLDDLLQRATPGSIAEAPVLVYLKLKSPRMKDRTDVVELVKAGIDVDACRNFLAQHAPSFVEALDAAVARARAEE
jgi:hypothetical protein